MDLRIAAFKEALDNFVYLARIDLSEIRQMLRDERLHRRISKWTCAKI